MGSYDQGMSAVEHVNHYQRALCSDGIERINHQPWLWELTNSDLGRHGIQVAPHQHDDHYGKPEGLPRGEAEMQAWRQGLGNVGGTDQEPR